MRTPRILFPLLLAALVAPGAAGVDGPGPTPSGRPAAPSPDRVVEPPVAKDPAPDRSLGEPTPGALGLDGKGAPSWVGQRALAADGSIAATRWCLGAVEREVRDAEQRLSIKRDLYRLLLETGGDALDVALLARIGGERDLPVDEAVELARAVGGAVRDPERRAAALSAEGRLLAERGGDRETARELFELVQSAFPETDSGRGATDELWRLEHLSVGREVPDFVTHDAAGNVIRLSDYRGHVVVVRFWSFRDAASSDVLRREHKLVERLWDEPFTLIGVNGDPDRAEFTRRSEQHDIHWTQAFEGSMSGPAARAWRPRAWPSTYVVDAAGTLRAVAPPADELERLVGSLLEVERAPPTEEIDRDDRAPR